MKEEKWELRLLKSIHSRGRELFQRLIYQDSLKTAEDPSPEDPDSDNEADTKLKLEERCLWEINPLVKSIDKLDFNNTTNVEGKWFINENLDLAYLFALASDSVPSDTITDVDSDHVSAMPALTSLHAPRKSFSMTHETASDTHGAFFKVPAKYKG